LEEPKLKYPLPTVNLRDEPSTTFSYKEYEEKATFLSKVLNKTTDKFKVGDVVIILPEDHAFFLYVGVILENKLGKHLVRLLGDPSTVYFYPEELILYAEAKSE
jgi:hypothetical protein